jgi:hypothetical protein
MGYMIRHPLPGGARSKRDFVPRHWRQRTQNLLSPPPISRSVSELVSCRRCGAASRDCQTLRLVEPVDDAATIEAPICPECAGRLHTWLDSPDRLPPIGG